MTHDDDADAWLRAAAERQGFNPSDCTHDPVCGSALAHYERDAGVILDRHSPARRRIDYHETLGGLMTEGEISSLNVRDRENPADRRRLRDQQRSPSRRVNVPDAKAA